VLEIRNLHAALESTGGAAVAEAATELAVSAGALALEMISRKRPAD